MKDLDTEKYLMIHMVKQLFDSYINETVKMCSLL